MIRIFLTELSGLHSTRIQANAHIVYVRMIDREFDIKIIAVFVARRIITHHLSFCVLLLQFRLMFLYIQNAACDLCKIKHIRIRFRKI